MAVAPESLAHPPHQRISPASQLHALGTAAAREKYGAETDQQARRFLDCALPHTGSFVALKKPRD
jgi:hypothetical protein